MNALMLLALLQGGRPLAQPGLQSHGWSPILWFWVIFGALLVVFFFALAFRKPKLPAQRDDALSDRDRLDRGDREVYP